MARIGRQGFSPNSDDTCHSPSVPYRTSQTRWRLYYDCDDRPQGACATNMFCSFLRIPPSYVTGYVRAAVAVDDQSSMKKRVLTSKCQWP